MCMAAMHVDTANIYFLLLLQLQRNWMMVTPSNTFFRTKVPVFELQTNLMMAAKTILNNSRSAKLVHPDFLGKMVVGILISLSLRHLMIPGGSSL